MFPVVSVAGATQQVVGLQIDLLDATFRRRPVNGCRITWLLMVCLRRHEQTDRIEHRRQVFRAARECDPFGAL